MDKFYFYFILFLIYSFIGWAMEVCVTFPKYKKFVNRGFMLGLIVLYMGILVL